MKRNVKQITVYVPSEVHANRINTTLALRTMFHNDLKAGDNIVNCNHAQYAEIKRMQGSLYQVKE